MKETTSINICVSSTNCLMTTPITRLIRSISLPVHRVHQTCQCPKMNMCETHATECGCEARTAEARGPESRQQEVDSWAGRHRAPSPPARGSGSAVSSPSGVLGLWPALGLPYGIGAGHYILCPVVSSSIFFPRLISAVADRLLYFHTWCGLSANLGCRSAVA